LTTDDGARRPLNGGANAMEMRWGDGGDDRRVSVEKAALCPRRRASDRVFVGISAASAPRPAKSMAPSTRPARNVEAARRRNCRVAPASGSRALGGAFRIWAHKEGVVGKAVTRAPVNRVAPSGRGVVRRQSLKARWHRRRRCGIAASFAAEAAMLGGAGESTSIWRTAASAAMKAVAAGLLFCASAITQASPATDHDRRVVAGAEIDRK